MRLNELYDELYENGTWGEKQDEQDTILSMSKWDGLEVLEIGCGEGKLAIEIAERNANVDAIDISAVAIRNAISNRTHKNSDHTVQFSNLHYINMDRKYDVVVMQGVLEHFDSPFIDLRYIMNTLLKKGGYVITSSPNFLNPRGYVWMTLQYLLDVEMSLADKHFLAPWDFQDFCKDYGYGLIMKTCDQNWGSGDKATIDYRRRFKSGLFKSKISVTDEGIERFLSWFRVANQSFTQSDKTGANMVYKIIRGENENHS